MTLSVGTTFEAGDVQVLTTSGRGLNPEELTSMILPKILYIGPDVPADVRAAAEDQMHRMEMLLKHYFAQAQRSQNTSVYNVLMNAGHESAAELVRSL